MSLQIFNEVILEGDRQHRGEQMIKQEKIQENIQKDNKKKKKKKEKAAGIQSPEKT